MSSLQMVVVAGPGAGQLPELSSRQIVIQRCATWLGTANRHRSRADLPRVIAFAVQLPSSMSRGTLTDRRSSCFVPFRIVGRYR